jgi:predicted DNA binding protein
MSNHASTTAANGMSKSTDYTARGERSGKAKLTNRQVLEIRSCYARGLFSRRSRVTMAKLAERYRISTMQVKRILHREQWTHI